MRTTRTLTIVPVLFVGLLGVAGPAGADVVTVSHIVACNQEAREGVTGRGASPTPKDEAGALAARKQRADTALRPGATPPATQSEDPQIHGMDGEGALDGAYRASYRVCMRRSGF